MTVDTERPEGPRSSKGQRTRQRLLGSAKEVFEERGFVEARISDIAERAGLSYGVFYHYFSSKVEIFREVAAFHERRLGAAVVAETDLVPASDGDVLAAKLEAANRRYLAEYCREAALMRVIEQVGRLDVALGDARMYRHKLYTERLAAAITELQHECLADPGVDPMIGSQAIMAMVTRFAEAWFVESRVTCQFDEGVAQLNRLCLNAIRGADRRRSTAPEGRIPDSA